MLIPVSSSSESKGSSLQEARTRIVAKSRMQQWSYGSCLLLSFLSLVSVSLELFPAEAIENFEGDPKSVPENSAKPLKWVSYANRHRCTVGAFFGLEIVLRVEMWPLWWFRTKLKPCPPLLNILQCWCFFMFWAILSNQVHRLNDYNIVDSILPRIISRIPLGRQQQGGQGGHGMF